MLVIKFKTVLLIVITIVLVIGITIYLSNNAIISNTTPTTNKIVILDARSWSARGWYLLNILFKNVDFASV